MRRARAKPAAQQQALRIRVAAHRDAADATLLLIAQLRAHRIMTPRRKIEQAVRGMLERADRGFILIARLGASPVGVAYISRQWSLEHGGNSAWLDELYVMPEHRGRAIGLALLRAAMRTARRLKCRALDLEVDREHRRAEHLYARERFERLARARWVRIL